eukprot:CAMPEP_0176171316 /NCGR_PEP_ID=MMETSP0120_2-20121206/87699_1 /TAXON_ID=160619 /ORGANISM="Kryptoperidinium foliaceum, Strain CCMP 1326" /LENGTH=60 /DNA_ID=CAMNT_0017509131 /DNA_START=126 /DNA_END=304 /DNA_ORIENTATION=+
MNVVFKSIAALYMRANHGCGFHRMLAGSANSNVHRYSGKEHTDPKSTKPPSDTRCIGDSG